MFGDNELDYINRCRAEIIEEPSSVFIPDKNSLCKKVLNALKNEKILIPRNGHDQLPPDFYSPTHNLMFDALRVNDTEHTTETGSLVNEKFIRERKIEKEIKELGVFAKDCNIFCNSEYEDFREHSLYNFSNQAHRVINKHIEKIGTWEKELPGIKYKGLFVFDETELYFRGACIPLEKPAPYSSWAFLPKDYPPTLYYPWMDKKLMESVYDSDIDFLVWYCPYKYSTLTFKTRQSYPVVVILDVRYIKELWDYNYDEYTLG